jgi:FHA domain
MRCMLCGTANREDVYQCKKCGSDLSKEPKPFLTGRTTPAPTILVAKSSRSVQTDIIDKTDHMVSENKVDTADSVLAAGETTTQSGVLKTHYISPDDACAVSSAVTHKPRLVGFLVSYTWNTSGDAFRIYEGKNIFGSSESVDSPVPSDRMMSAEHFAVMVRAGRIKIKDLTTTNATIVDGVEIWGDSVDAGHGTKIHAGTTEFILTLIP